MASETLEGLSAEQIEQFLEHGWVKVENCFTREQAEEVQKTLWTRLGMDERDMSTWTKERIHMPHHTTFPLSTFSPRARSAIISLLGSENRINPSSLEWKDSFIVNLGTPETHNKPVPPQKLTNWHCDGDFFVHYLDSPEQGLLVIPLFSDIQPNGGGTMLCPPAIPLIAKHLYENPAGVSPRMTPRAKNPTFSREEGGPDDGLEWFNSIARGMPDEAFVEATGKVGDVYLLHPLMMHSASRNALRVPRVITNPPVSLKEPFCFNREDGAYCVVERMTLRALGKEEGTGDWKITAQREGVVPERVRVQERMRREEEERLRRAGEKGGLSGTVVEVTASAA